ncbi:hypothetical protein Tco_1359816 [Tanacetum coccineum]
MVAPETSAIALVISSAAPVVETTLVASPTGLCGLVPYSGSNSDSPDKMASPEHISLLPAISPFLCIDSSKALDSSDGPPSQNPYDSSNRVQELLSDLERLSLLVGPYRTLLMGRDAPDQTHFGSLIVSLPPDYVTSKESSTIVKAFLHWLLRSLSTFTEIDMELGIGDGDDVRDHIEIDPRDVRDDTKEYEADTSVRDTVEVGIDSMSAPIVKEEIVKPAGEDSSGTRDGIVRSFEDMPIDLNDAVRDFYYHMSEVRIDRIVEIKTVQRRLEAGRLMAKGQRVSMIKRIDSLRLENLKVYAMLDIKRDHVNSLRLHMSLSQEEFRQVRRDRVDTRERLRRLESYVVALGFSLLD